MELSTARDVADWLDTSPPEHMTDHAIDELTDAFGHHRALRVWAAGRRLHDEARS